MAGSIMMALDAVRELIMEARRTEATAPPLSVRCLGR